MIVMEHSCRLNVLCFLATIYSSVSHPFIKLFSPVNTVSLLFHSFLQSILADSSRSLFVDGEFAIYLPTVADWQITYMHCLLSGTGKPDEFAELIIL